MTNSHRGPQIPIAPFKDWCNEQIRLETARQYHPEGWGNGAGGRTAPPGAVSQVAARLGIHVRILNRLKRGMYAGCINGVKGEFPASTISRYYVEDLLARAGFDFYDLYPEFLHERDVELADEAWCRCCREFVNPVEGRCLWCDTPTHHLDVAA